MPADEIEVMRHSKMVVTEAGETEYQFRVVITHEGGETVVQKQRAEYGAWQWEPVETYRGDHRGVERTVHELTGEVTS